MLFYISVQKKNIFLQSTILLLLIFVYQHLITFTLLLQIKFFLFKFINEN